ncbi:MAG: hypothetical protein ABI238_04550 [Terrimesophilobacter sp.]
MPDAEDRVITYGTPETAIRAPEREKITASKEVAIRADDVGDAEHTPSFAGSGLIVVDIAWRPWTSSPPTTCGRVVGRDESRPPEHRPSDVNENEGDSRAEPPSQRELPRIGDSSFVFVHSVTESSR